MAELASTNIYGHLTVHGDVRVSSIIGKADVISIPTTVLMEHTDFGQQLIVKRNSANSAAAITYENSSGILGRAGFAGTGTYAIYYGTSTTAAWEIDASGVLQKGTIPWSRLSSVPSYASRWPSWSEVTGKPSTFTPSSHTHAAGDITSGTIAAARLPSASTSAAGIVQLSSATNSTSTTLAATASAVKAAYDLAASKWTYNEGTIKGVKVNNATTADVLDSKDTRGTNHLPQDRGKGVYADFKSNSTSGLWDGGSYHGILTFRPYGSPTDFSGGYPHQLAFTENENIWYRKGTNASAWSSWKKIWHDGNAPATATRWPSWGEVTGKPSTFTPSSHTHSKSDVGLGNVQNYGIATQAQAQAGTANNVYMTPLRVKEAISSLASVRIAEGSYVGNSPDGREGEITINVGFTPKMVVIKRARSDFTNATTPLVIALTGAVGGILTQGGVKIVTNGFTVRAGSDGGGFNKSGTTYRYFAIA